VVTWNEYQPYTRADVKRILGRMTPHIRFVDLRTGRLISTVLTLWEELEALKAACREDVSICDVRRHIESWEAK